MTDPEPAIITINLGTFSSLQNSQYLFSLNPQLQLLAITHPHPCMPNNSFYHHVIFHCMHESHLLICLSVDENVGFVFHFLAIMNNTTKISVCKFL